MLRQEIRVFKVHFLKMELIRSTECLIMVLPYGISTKGRKSVITIWTIGGDVLWLTSYFPLHSYGVNKSNRKNWSKLAAWENQFEYQDVFVWLANLYFDTFKWVGLPETCNERALEMTLFFHGKALFFRDDDVVSKGKIPEIMLEGKSYYWHTPVNLLGGINIYNEYAERHAYSYNYNKQFNISNSVLIRANRQQYPMYLTTTRYAEKLADIQRAIDVATRNTKIPFIITTSREQLESTTEMFNKVWNNEPAIFTNEGLMDNKIEVLQTGAAASSGVLQELWETKRTTLNEYLVRIGKNNENQEKRERLLVDEVNANNQLTDDSIGFELEARKEACELINQMFGLNVSVELRNKKEVMEDGLYNDTGGTRSEQANQSTD